MPHKKYGDAETVERDGQTIPKSLDDALNEYDRIVDDFVGTVHPVPCKQCGRETPHTYKMNDDKGWLDNQCNECGGWWLELNPPQFP